MNARTAALFAVVAGFALARGAAAQHEHEHEHEHGPGHGREGSGTSWVPDATPVHAVHLMFGDWMVMVHGAASVGYDQQLGPRGGRGVHSNNWLMAMVSLDSAGGTLAFRAMLSLEPLTVGGAGFPLLLQTGETWEGAPLRDRQHPHDAFMELAAMFRHPLGELFGLEVYLAAAGEPALGPTAFMHRASAAADPFPPISHHWQDSTHVAFGVATAALTTPLVGGLKLDVSWFNGREPDEFRWNFDFRAFDSVAARISANPTENLSAQVSYGFLASPEASAPDESVQRITASATWSAPLDLLGDGHLDATAVWGRNVEGGRAQDSLLVEATADLDGHHVPFARAEWVQKSAHDLVLAGPGFDDRERSFGLFNVVLGYLYRFDALGPIAPALGCRLNIGIVPAELAAEYGTRTPAGFFTYLLFTPS